MERVLLVAIDFGSTFTAVAWAQTAQPDIQNIITKWPDTSGSLEGEGSDQVPTQVAYEGSRCLWGFQIPEETRRYELFKLGLNTASSSKRSFLSLKYPSARSIPLGAEKSASDLTTDFLRELHGHIMRTLRSKLGNGVVNSTPIRYTITVPAIWSDSAKDLTLKCARDAGIGTDTTLLSEPEAAATYVLATRDHALAVDDEFVVTDAGGGTADLISYKVANVGRPVVLREVVPGTGDPLGSSYLDRIFREWLEDRFKHLEEWDEEILHEAMLKFESTTKRKFSGREDWLNIPVYGLPDDPDKNIKRGVLKLSNKDLKGIFDIVVSGITGHVSAQVQRTSNPKAIFLVGGFGENGYLCESVKEVVGHEVEVIQPPNAWTSIVRGALLKALAGGDPGSARVKVDARAARKSYGIYVCHPFNPRKHPRKRRYWSGFHGKYLIQLLDWEVKQGSVVKESEPLVLKYRQWREITDGRFKACSETIYSHSGSGKDGEAPPEILGGEVKVLANIEADLSRIPNDMFPIVLGSDGQQYYICNYEIRVHFYSALTEWSLWHNDKCYGKVDAEYI